MARLSGRDRPHRASIRRAIVAASAIGWALARTRAWYLTWGAGRDGAGERMPGDDMLPRADLVATRAITVQAPPERVWPWIAQLGQGRGGLYSYDALENLVGCDIHSADEVVDEWQHIAVGDPVRLHPQVALEAVEVVPGRALVLRGAVGPGSAPPPYDFTWSFALRPGPGGTGTTRLAVRERYAYRARWAPLLVEPAAAVSALMSQRMLRGIRDRAERSSTPRAGAG